MSRSMKWILVVVVLLALVYAALVAVTGSQVRAIAEQQLSLYAQQNPDVDATLEWHQTGFRRSVGNLRLELDIEGETLALVHSVTLTHGALRARIQGEANAVMGDFSVADTLYAGQPLTLDGRVGLGGITLSYQVPELRLEDDEVQMSYRVAPFAFDVVLRERDQHAHFEIEWAEIAATVIGATDVMRWEGISFTSYTQLEEAGGEFEQGSSRFRVASLVFGDYVDAIATIHDMSSDIEVWREDDLVRAEGTLAVADYDMYGVSGELDFNFNVANVPFSGFRAWQEQSTEEDALYQLLHSMQQQQTQLSIDHLQLTMGEMGNLQAQGQFALREDIDFSQHPSLDDAADVLQGRLMIEDLPLLLLMPLSSLISGELPWALELNEGELLINGEALELP